MVHLRPPGRWWSSYGPALDAIRRPGDAAGHHLVDPLAARGDVGALDLLVLEAFGRSGGLNRVADVRGDFGPRRGGPAGGDASALAALEAAIDEHRAAQPETLSDASLEAMLPSVSVTTQR